MWVFVENLEFVGQHGVYEEERRDGRTFRIDVAAQVADRSMDDEIGNTLDYRRLVDVVLDVGMGDSVQLVETLAARIIRRTFEKHGAVDRVQLTIRKKAPDVAGSPEWVGARFDVARDAWLTGFAPDDEKQS